MKKASREDVLNIVNSYNELGKELKSIDNYKDLHSWIKTIERSFDYNSSILSNGVTPDVDDNLKQKLSNAFTQLNALLGKAYKNYRENAFVLYSFTLKDVAANV